MLDPGQLAGGSGEPVLSWIILPIVLVTQRSNSVIFDDTVSSVRLPGIPKIQMLDFGFNRDSSYNGNTQIQIQIIQKTNETL